MSIRNLKFIRPSKKSRRSGATLDWCGGDESLTSRVGGVSHAVGRGSTKIATCVYQKLRSECNGDGARQELRVTGWFRPAEPGDGQAHLCPTTSVF